MFKKPDKPMIIGLRHKLHRSSALAKIFAGLMLATANSACRHRRPTFQRNSFVGNGHFWAKTKRS